MRMSICPTRSLDVVDCGDERVELRDVERRHVRGEAGSLDLGAQLLEPVDAARGEHHVGAGCRQHLGEARTETARRAGDDRHLSFRFTLNGMALSLLGPKMIAH